MPGVNANTITGRDIVGVGEPAIGERIVRVGRDGLLKQIDTFLQAFRGAPVPGLPSFQVKAVGLGIAGPRSAQVLLLVPAEPDSQTAGNIARDVALHLRDVSQFALIMRPPKLAAIGRTHQIGLDADFIAALRDASHEQSTHLKRLPDLPRIILAPLETKRCAASHDLEVRKLRKRVNQALGQAIAQVIVVWIGSSVDEGQHGQGADSLCARSAAHEVQEGGRSRHQYHRRDAGKKIFSGTARSRRNRNRASRHGGNATH